MPEPSGWAVAGSILRLLVKGYPGCQPQGPELAPLVAIIGCDGSGKSTVSAALLAWLRESRPAEYCHLGVQSRALGEALMALPVAGPRIRQLIGRHTRQANQGGGSHPGQKGPGTLVALATSLLSLRRLWRFQRMLLLRQQGITIIADRYPQIAVPRMKIDGPGLAAGPCRNALVCWLARREKALYDYMTGYRPDLVIRLNVDLDTACARKPDHNPESLAAKIAAVPLLEYRGAPIVDLDSREPLPEVLAQARAAVAARLAGC